MWKTIDRDELSRKLRETPGKTLVVDVRDREDYERAHIKGAISVPLTELNMRAAKGFDVESEIVVYCGSFECQASVKAAKILARKGYKNVMEYQGGLDDWEDGGLPTEGLGKARAA